MDVFTAFAESLPRSAGDLLTIKIPTTVLNHESLLLCSQGSRGWRFQLAGYWLRQGTEQEVEVDRPGPTLHSLKNLAWSAA